MPVFMRPYTDPNTGTAGHSFATSGRTKGGGAVASSESYAPGGSYVASMGFRPNHEKQQGTGTTKMMNADGSYTETQWKKRADGSIRALTSTWYADGTYGFSSTITGADGKVTKGNWQTSDGKSGVIA